MKHQTRVILGGFMGNVVEAYDMSICYFLSSELSRHLLGDHTGNPSIMFLLIFIAYLAKPIGAFGLGLLSDLYGRKNVLIFSILIMGCSTTLIGFIPNFESIGFLAAALLLSLRVIQSMALGSEFLNSASYMVESGDNNHRGFRGCWPSVGVKAGYLLACIMVEVIHYLTEHQAQQLWLWRVPFWLAFLTTLMGLYIRYSMPESLGYIKYYAGRLKPNTGEIYRQSLRFIKLYPFMFRYAFFASFLSVATGFFFYLYIPLHAIQYSHLPRFFIFLSTSLSLAFVSILIPFFGWISDKQDRLKMLAASTLGLFVLSYPFIFAMNHGGKGSFLVMQLVISIPCACYYSVSSVILTELFPIQIRCTALSIVFSIAASLAAGIPPLLSDYLVRTTHYSNSPCLIMILLSGIVLVNIKTLTKKYRIRRNMYKIIVTETDPILFELSYQKPQISPKTEGV